MTTILRNYRSAIDIIDQEIVRLISKRMAIVRKVGIYKKKKNIAPLDQKRWNDVLSKVVKMGNEGGISKELIIRIFTSIHEEALSIEKTL